MRCDIQTKIYECHRVVEMCLELHRLHIALNMEQFDVKHNRNEN